jgi:hypothetical protein
MLGKGSIRNSNKGFTERVVRNHLDDIDVHGRMTYKECYGCCGRVAWIKITQGSCSEGFSKISNGLPAR